MLQIHFTPEDLARTRFAPGPDPMWELVISLHRIQRRDSSVLFGPWRRQVMPRIPVATGMISALSPPVGYGFDFLTPQTGGSLSAQAEALRATPQWRLRNDFAAHGMLNPRRRLPSWSKDLFDGRSSILTTIADAALAYFAACLEPYWRHICNEVRHDTARRARAMVSGGWSEVFSKLHPSMRWDYPVLSVGYPVDKVMRLEGRGLVLQPSFFCRYGPTSLVDPVFDPVLVYPIEHQPGWALDGTRDQCRSLSALIGRTRSDILRAVADGISTTTDLAVVAGVTHPTASRHLAVLGEAALVISHRHRNTTLHSITDLGTALLNGAQPWLPA
ncbi:ArsR/SmtB family transcription factor [Streptomyces cinnamoneus]|uniref:Transcriptional regulator n=1 Tax=Streptomyces cinnamoneus TaxID=53446 RepID=A0A918WGM9_STRCJ|nr:winged helix-turn-helix domain-containing protein [Streptomyces cinnamoneus]GHC45899.1 transcriptional regulator [Streptomyces cinnamoneus]